MNIFRHIFVLAALVPALASCLSSVKQDGDRKVIVFEPVVGTEVRSENTVSFPESTEIGVWAVTPDGKTFFEREKVVFDGEKWTTEVPHYWPRDTKLRFFGYAPYGCDVNSDENGSLAIDSYDLSDDSDGLYISEVTPDCGIDAGAVHMTFRSATSKIDFRVDNGLNQVTSVKVEKIILCGVYVHGSFDEDADPQWTLSGEPADIVAYDCTTDGGDNSIGRDPKFLGKTLEVLPQQSFPTVKVIYSFVNADSEWLPGQENSTEELQAKWEAGRHYTYTLILTETIVKHSTGIASEAE